MEETKIIETATAGILWEEDPEQVAVFINHLLYDLTCTRYDAV